MDVGQLRNLLDDTDTSIFHTKFIHIVDSNDFTISQWTPRHYIPVIGMMNVNQINFTFTRIFVVALSIHHRQAAAVHIGQI